MGDVRGKAVKFLAAVGRRTARERRIARFNDWLAAHMALGLSSMWTFWTLTLLIAAALLLQRPTGAQGWVLFVVSIFFQGVALPVLAFVSNQQGDRTEGILRETHDTVMKELEDLRALHAERTEELAELRALHEEDRAWRERIEAKLTASGS